MSTVKYRPEATALLIVDPYNDFLSEGGLIWPRMKEVAEEVGLLDNLRAIQGAARAAGVRIFIVPHRQWEEANYEGWQNPTDAQRWSQAHHFCAKGTWGGEFRAEFAPQDGDVVVQQHWGSSGFANTDLDMQLKQRDISHLILVGLIANTCIETTGRYGMELGYHITLVRDATAAQTREMMHAAHDLNGPTYAHSILKTKEVVEALR
jgi:nicotinamidase-related amidase